MLSMVLCTRTIESHSKRVGHSPGFGHPSLAILQYSIEQKATLINIDMIILGGPLEPCNAFGSGTAEQTELMCICIYCALHLLCLATMLKGQLINPIRADPVLIEVRF